LSIEEKKELMKTGYQDVGNVLNSNKIGPGEEIKKNTGNFI
jgi:hypothetical protein